MAININDEKPIEPNYSIPKKNASTESANKPTVAPVTENKTEVKTETAVEAKPEIKTAPKPATPEPAPVATSEDKGEYGSKSNTVQVLATLTDASLEKRFKVTDPITGEETDKVAGTIIGYRLLFTEDTEIPDVPIGDPKNLMSYKRVEDLEKTRHVKAGEYADLTRLETALLLSKDEYNGVFSANKTIYIGSYNTDPNKVGPADALPTVSLNGRRGKGLGIRDLPEIPVIQFTQAVAGGTKNRFLNPEFVEDRERWEGRLIVNERSLRALSVHTSERNARAEDFLTKVRNLSSQRANQA